MASGDASAHTHSSQDPAVRLPNGVGASSHESSTSSSVSFAVNGWAPSNTGISSRAQTRNRRYSRQVSIVAPDQPVHHSNDPHGTPTDRIKNLRRANSFTGSFTLGERAEPHTRLSIPVELLQNSYDAVVIGSGYGGGVAASRMARAGQSVCLLERGKERWPGEYPHTLSEASKHLHISGFSAPWESNGRMVPNSGDPTDMYHLILGDGQNVFVGNGLGGTSLVNANVFLEADEKTLSLHDWPEEIRNKPSVLEEYYERAESVLEPTPYPDDYPPLTKLQMLEKQAHALGYPDRFSRVKQTTRFADGPNSTGVQMRASTLSGQDSTGINDGSKTTTLVTYISDAWNWGAEIFCECEVRYVKKHPDEGYIIFFAWHGSRRGEFQRNLNEDLMWVHARKYVFLGAGAIGTTEILLRSKAHGLKMSDLVGKKMSGNGDILAFGYDTDQVVNPMGREIPKQKQPIGPTITGIIDRRDEANPNDGYVIEEGAIPSALAPLFQLMLEATLGKIFPTNLTIVQKLNHFLARISSVFLGPYFIKGSIEKTQVYLVMSHDSNQASLTLRGEKPMLRFEGVGSSARVTRLHQILQQATSAVGGTYINSPFYANFGQQEITVHPIGGAVMSADGTTEYGVTSHIGEVLNEDGGVYEGLFCVDGSVVPTALGVNPFATITALAERTLQHVTDRDSIKIDWRKNGILDLVNPQHHRKPSGRVVHASSLINAAKRDHRQGFRFTEVMSGYIHIGDDIHDYELAYTTARGRCEAARFFLSVRSWDVDQMIHSRGHKGLLTGSVACALPDGPFMVHQGDFSLFSEDERSVEAKNLTYDFNMISTRGEVIHFHGYKVVDSSIAFAPGQLWKATTTLYVTLSDPRDRSIKGRGILHISPSDLSCELASMSAASATRIGKVLTTGKFLGYFLRQSASLFFAPFTRLHYPTQTYQGYIDSIEATEETKVKASDGVLSVVRRWEPTESEADFYDIPTIFMIPGAAVDHQIFALPTIEKNAIDYFREAGYRCYTVTHRIGMNPANEKISPTTFDARLDIHAAMEHIYKEIGKQKFYVIAHCMGSVAFSAGLLDGTIPADWISGITCSQTFFNPKWSLLNILKTMSPVPLDKVYRKVVGMWFSCSSKPNDFFVQQCIDQALRLYPVGSRSELCSSVVCHRCSFVFGRCWNHENLNEDTHAQLDRFFSGVNMNFLHHAMLFGDLGNVVTNAPLYVNLVTPRNLERLRGIPIMLFSGEENQVLRPESTDTSYTTLRDMFGNQNYERYVVPGYGHLDSWMGKNSYKDVYPMVKRHVDRVMLEPLATGTAK